MEVGIIGAGRLGQAMARTALRAGRRIVMANSRGPESLASSVAAIGDGASAGTVDEAATADIVSSPCRGRASERPSKGSVGTAGSSSTRRTTSTPATSTGGLRARFWPISSRARAS